MKTPAKDPAAYLAGIDDARRPHVEKLRALVKKAVPKATEAIVWGMLGYTYEGRPFAAIASHKSYLSLYLMDLYVQPGLREKHAKALSKLQMGKSCINFDTLDELPLETIAAILKEAPRVKVTSGTMASVEAAKKKRAAAKTKAKRTTKKA